MYLFIENEKCPSLPPVNSEGLFPCVRSSFDIQFTKHNPVSIMRSTGSVVALVKTSRLLRLISALFNSLSLFFLVNSKTRTWWCGRCTSVLFAHWPSTRLGSVDTLF